VVKTDQHPLRRFRLEAGWSIDALAAETGINKSTISRIETWHLWPRIDVIAKILDAIDGRGDHIDANDFLPSHCQLLRQRKLARG
jgi:transcriptional regulator with XRE-family HTH domain